MLKAVSIAKEYGYSQYKEQLNFIKLNYSNTIEGKEAEYILEEVLPLPDPMPRPTLIFFLLFFIRLFNCII